MNQVTKYRFFPTLLLLLSVSFTALSAAKKTKTILYIDSYQDNHIWSQKVHQGITAQIQPKEIAVQYKNIYLNAKEINSSEQRKNILKAHLSEIREKVDVIIVTGLEATEHVLTVEDSILKNTPIVFGAFIDRSFFYTQTNPNICGYVGNIDFTNTFLAAREIFPLSRKAYVISDKTALGQLFLKKAKEQLNDFENIFNIEYADSFNNSQELIDYVQKIEPNSFVIFGTWEQDTQGRMQFPEVIYPNVINATTAPVFVVSGNIWNDPFAGGYVVSPNALGESIGKDCVKIMEGTPPAVLGIRTLKATPIFDKKVIRTKNGTAAAIPKEAVVLHSFSSQIKEHAITIALSLFSIILLVVWVLQMRYKQLLKKNKVTETETMHLLKEVKLLSLSKSSLDTYTWVCDLDTGEIAYGGGIESVGVDVEQINTTEKFFDKIHPEDIESIKKSYAQLEHKTSGEFSFVYRMDPKKMGEYKWYESRGMIEMLPNGKRSALGIVININKHKLIEFELQQALLQAERSDRLKSAFLANMSHEIRTPLNAIVGFSSLMIDATREERQEYERVIQLNNQLLLKLIGDILDLSKIEAGYIDFKKAPFDFALCLNEIRESFSLRVPQGVALRCEVPSVRYKVEFDKGRLSQIICNFISNALKFTTKGEIRIKGKVVKNGIKVIVSDTGTGISKENLPKVFGRFEKLNEFAQGTGLGMAICKAIVDACSGEIGVESEPGKGTMFWIFIPCVCVENESKL